jgi:TetR/AcrR family transcriptional regulator, cholesterol catabolism regulator
MARRALLRSYPRDSRGRFDSAGHADERLAALISAAARLFAEKGYHATSMTDLTDAAGLGRGGLYHYIDSKLDLLFMIHEQVIAPLQAEVRDVDKRQLDPPEALRAIAKALMRSISSRPNEVSVFLHEWKTMSSQPHWKAVRKKRRDLELIIKRTFDRGVMDGSLQVADTQLACFAFLGMINYSYTWFDPSGEWSFDEIADSFCTMLLAGVEVTPKG